MKNKTKKDNKGKVKCLNCGNEVSFGGDLYCVRCDDTWRDCNNKIKRGQVRCYDCSICE